MGVGGPAGGAGVGGGVWYIIVLFRQWPGGQGQDRGGKWGQPFKGPGVSVGLGLNSFHEGFQEEVLVSRAG